MIVQGQQIYYYFIINVCSIYYNFSLSKLLTITSSRKFYKTMHTVVLNFQFDFFTNSELAYKAVQ